MTGSLESMAAKVASMTPAQRAETAWFAVDGIDISGAILDGGSAVGVPEDLGRGLPLVEAHIPDDLRRGLPLDNEEDLGVASESDQRRARDSEQPFWFDRSFGRPRQDGDPDVDESQR